MTIGKQVLKCWMKQFSRISHSAGQWQGLNDAKRTSNDQEKIQSLLRVSQARYDGSKIDCLDEVFGFDLRPELEGKDLLEVGSNHGGAALYYFEKYNLKSITGVDTSDRQAEISKIFFENKGVTSNFHFQKAFAEDLPFPSDSFDNILTFDVVEHVADVKQTLNEFYRVLRPGGKAFIVFPSYSHPTAHHLVSVTKAPLIHWIYSPETLIEVYYDILDEYPDYKARTSQSRRKLESWEKLLGINGTTLKEFRQHIQQQPWKKRTHIPRPFLTDGQLIKKYPLLKIFNFIFKIGSRMPILSECCNRRLVFVLEK